MNIQIKSSNGITLMPLETRLLASRKIFIEGEINTETACEFVKQVLHLNQEDGKKELGVGHYYKEGSTYGHYWVQMFRG